MTLSRRTVPLLLTLPTLALAACGGGSDSDKIKDIVKDVDKDNAAICDHATDKLLAQLGGDTDACKKTARGYPDTDHVTGDIAVKIDGDKATADFKTAKGDKQHVTFVKDGGEWKVDTAG